MLKKQADRKKRHRRTRARISGTEKRPRICIFRSNKHFYVQLIDDQKGKVLAAVSDFQIKDGTKLTKLQLAEEIGKQIAQKAKGLKIDQAVFDKSGYKYHGRVSAAAKGARQAGLNF